jgi:acyl-CoA synthetase (NDP forming)
MTALSPRIALNARLDRLLRPRSITAIGGQAAAEIVRQSEKIGFTGAIWPVHPMRKTVAGKPAFKSIADLPGIPDAAFIGVNRHASIDIMAALAAIGCGGAVAFASGYAEAGGAGVALQADLLQAAAGMPFLGPNCYGFLNYLDQSLVWPDQFGGRKVARGVAIITQSGNIGLNITMHRRALPIGYLITLGNQASISHATAMEAVLDDPRVTAIGLHMEAVGDPHALAAATARARARGIPVVALKTGRTAAGARIAESHTASLASGDKVVDAFFRRIGVARVNSIPALLETLKLLHLQGPLPGKQITSLSCSGGEAALIADAAEAAGVNLKPLSPDAAADIASTLPELVHVSNPLDYHTFGWRNRPALAATFAAMMRAGADLNLLILDFPRPDRCDTSDWDIAAAAMADAAQVTGRRAAVLATLPDAMPEAHAEALAAQGIVPFFGLDEALAAITAAADAAIQAVDAPILTEKLTGEPVMLSESAGKQLLAARGITVPTGAQARSTQAAAQAASNIGFPVAVKASGKNLAHKTELGAVRLNLRTTAEVEAAAEILLPMTGEVLIEQMVTGTVAELIVGVTRDPVLGLHLMLGSGGTLAELLGDTAILLLPATRQQIATALQSLRVAKLLAGFRAATPADTEAAIDSILAIQDFAIAHRTRLAELEVNPLMVRATGQGAVAADVLMRLTPEPAHV